MHARGGEGVSPPSAVPSSPRQNQSVPSAPNADRFVQLLPPLHVHPRAMKCLTSSRTTAPGRNALRKEGGAARVGRRDGRNAPPPPETPLAVAAVGRSTHGSLVAAAAIPRPSQLPLAPARTRDRPRARGGPRARPEPRPAPWPRARRARGRGWARRAIRASPGACAATVVQSGMPGDPIAPRRCASGQRGAGSRSNSRSAPRALREFGGRARALARGGGGGRGRLARRPRAAFRGAGRLRARAAVVRRRRGGRHCSHSSLSKRPRALRPAQGAGGRRGRAGRGGRGRGGGRERGGTSPFPPRVCTSPRRHLRFTPSLFLPPPIPRSLPPSLLPPSPRLSPLGPGSSPSPPWRRC